MKKILLLSFVTALFQVNAQISPSNPVTNVLILTNDIYHPASNAITVPEGKFWVIEQETNDWNVVSPDGLIIDAASDFPVPSGYSLYCEDSFDGNTARYLTIYEYSYSTDEGMGFNDDDLKDRIKLFPNPTTNQLALNSDKVYQIEVFDLTGNKVMELKGNTINVEHLSSATYIVNAIDLETNESLSYKVVKK